MRIAVDTNDIAPTQRLASWRSLLCDTYVGLDCDFDDENFRVVISGQSIGGQSITRITSSAHSVERSRTLIHRDGVEVVFFGLVLAGRIGLCQDGREAVVAAGSFVFSDSTRPFRTYLGEASDVCWITIDKSVIARRLGHEAGHLTAVSLTPTAPLRPIATAFFRGLDAALDVDPAPRNADQLVDQAAALLAMTMNATQMSLRRTH